MFAYAQKDDYQHARMLAGFQGVDLDKEAKKKAGESDGEGSKFMFKDPADYKDMTQEEKEEETQRMMGYHKSTVKSEGHKFDLGK